MPAAISTSLRVGAVGGEFHRAFHGAPDESCIAAEAREAYEVVSFRFQLTPFGRGVASWVNRERVSYASRARAGRSRQRQSK
jgi:hypothetical protein